MVDLLDKQDKSEIVNAIIQAEKMTSGEIRVHVQKKCKGDAFHAAVKVFRRLKMHKTKHRSGILIFIAYESRKLAILGDLEIHRHVGDSFWDETRDKIASYFSKGRIKDGIIKGVLTAGEKLRKHFPLDGNDKNELSNEITGR